MSTKAPTPLPVQASITAMFEFMLYACLERLYFRWLDESEYEDIADYGAVVAKHLPKGFALVRMTKRPFGFEFTAAAYPEARYAATVTSRGAAWKRLA
jgi:hypothetical protein